MPVTDSYKYAFEELVPFNKHEKPQKAGKGSNMSESTTKSKSPVKSYNKTRGEHFKDIIIAILIVGVIAFIGGMQFQKSHDAEIKAAVNAVEIAPVQTSVKK